MGFLSSIVKSASGPSSPAPPSCPSPPCPLDPEYHMHVDADRDGKVDDDRTGLDVWEWGKGKKGAIILCNNDGDSSPSTSDNTDSVVNNGNDPSEIAPLVIRRTGGSPPVMWQATLEVSVDSVSTAAAKDCIRIFDGRSSGANEIIGPTKGNKYTFPNLNFVEKELGMEAVQYAGATFNGEITITFTLFKVTVPPPAATSATPSGLGAAAAAIAIAASIAAATQVVSEKAKVRVAPWMMPNHLDAATKVFVVELPADSVNNPDVPAGLSDNARFRSDLNTFVTGAGCTLKTHPEVDRWMQDCMELGYSNLPLTGYQAVMRNPRPRELETFAKTLRAADFGYHEQGDITRETTFNSTGNLECTPPVTSAAGKVYPWGRIYYGPGRSGEEIDPKMAAFLKAQTVQAPIQVDTNFMAVGHVDEIMTFVPAPGGKGFKLLLASPSLAYSILNANKAAHGGDKMLTRRRFIDYAARRWRSAEVTIKDFLDTGIPAMELSTTPPTAKQFTATALKTFNDNRQADLDANRKKLVSELGLDPSDIIDVPILFFPNENSPTQADALTAGMVNMLVINKHCVVPKPFGPVVGTEDLFEKDLKDKLTPLGLTVHFLDDWYEYHIALGEVHCGTNTLRTPTQAKWWEFTP